MRGTAVVVVVDSDVGCDQTGPRIVTDWLSLVCVCRPVMFAGSAKKAAQLGTGLAALARTELGPAGSFAKCGLGTRHSWSSLATSVTHHTEKTQADTHGGIMSTCTQLKVDLQMTLEAPVGPEQSSLWRKEI